MLTVDTRGGAIALLIAALFCLGTWGPFLNRSERAGRHTAHCYMDFSIAFALTSLVCALTLGQFGHSGSPTPNEQFIYQLQHSSEKAPLIGFAFTAGVSIFLGNMGLMYALALCGVCIAVPLFSSWLVIVGTTLNYFLDRSLNKATLLFPGVACFFLAFVAGAITHLSNERFQAQKKAACARTTDGGAADAKHLDDSAHAGNTLKDDVELAKVQDPAPVDMGPVQVQHALADPDAPQRAVRLTDSQKLFWGIIVACGAGIVGSLFSPGFNVVTNDSFNTLAPGVKPFTVYTGYFYFCVPYIPLGLVQSAIFFQWPPLGQPKSSWMGYLKDHKGSLWLWSFAAGVIVSAANVLQFLGGQAAGYAASDLVQANPIIATIWGVLMFREYRKSNAITYVFLGCMYALYIAAIALLAASAKTRGT